jgi:hypothetical protein
MQEHWIGKSEGVRFAFPHDIRDDGGHLIQDGKLCVFTTRADTIMGVTFCAVAAEHPLAAHAARRDPKLADFIEQCKKGGTTEAELALREKEGMPTGLHVTHPLTDEKIEVWVGNYVLMGYGDGAVMGVPAHDERDFAFAKKYGIDILQVIAVDGEEEFSYDHWQEWYADKQRGITVNSDNFSGMPYKVAVDAIAAALDHKGFGGKKTTWRLRDWGISRQRYWGTPIPIIHCPACGDVPVPEKDLPVMLPEDLIPDGSGNPLNKSAAFLNVACPSCGAAAKRETDTMDTFVDSAWYYMRYCCPDNHERMVDERNDYWMPMDQYIGGIEHAVLHLLYARFWTKAMRDLGLVTFDEPFTKLFTQGMLLNESFYRDDEAGKKRWFYPSEGRDPLRRQGPPVAPPRARTGSRCSSAASRRCRSRRTTWSSRATSSRSSAPTPRACSRCSPVRRTRARPGPTPAPKAPIATCAACGPSARSTATHPRAGRRHDGRARREGPAPRGAHAAAPDQPRLRPAAVQHRRLGRDEAAQRARRRDARPTRRPTTRRCAKASACCCARCTRPRRTSRTRCGRARLRAEHGDLLDAPWPQGRRGRAAAGRDRVRAAGQRQAARSVKVPAAPQAHDRAAALREPRVLQVLRGQAREEGDRAAGPASSTWWCDAMADAIAPPCSRGRALAARRLRLRAAPRARDALSDHRAGRLQARSPLGEELRMNINASHDDGGRRGGAQAQVVLEALERCTRARRRRQHRGRPGARDAAAQPLPVQRARRRRQAS